MVEQKKNQPSANKQNHLATTPQNKVNKALAELAIRWADMGWKKKYTATMVNKLFAGIEMPFTKQVTDHQLPNKFKVSQILSNSGIGDPIEHLENHQIHLALHAMLDEIACRAFPMTL